MLMPERPGRIRSAQRKTGFCVKLPEQQTYIQRNADVYEYLTDEEKDIEEEIKNTEVEAADIVKELDTLLFDGVIKQRKIRHSNGQDYPYTRKMDDRALSKEHELTIHIVTPLVGQRREHHFATYAEHGADELRIVLPLTRASCKT